MISKKRGRYKEAEAYYERALKIIEAVYGSDHPKVALYIHNLGVIYRYRKQQQEVTDLIDCSIL